MVLIVSGPKWSLDQTHHHITTWMLSSASRTLSLSRDQPFKEEQNLWQYLDLQRAADTVIQKHSNSYSVHGGNAHVMGELKTYVLHLHGPPYLRSTTAVFWFLALLLIVKAFHLCQWSTSGPTALTHTHTFYIPAILRSLVHYSAQSLQLCTGLTWSSEGFQSNIFWSCITRSEELGKLVL